MFRKEWYFSKLPVLRSHKNVFHTAFASTLTSGHLKCWFIKSGQFVSRLFKTMLYMYFFIKEIFITIQESFSNF